MGTCIQSALATRAALIFGTLETCYVLVLLTTAGKMERVEDLTYIILHRQSIVGNRRKEKEKGRMAFQLGDQYIEMEWNPQYEDNEKSRLRGLRIFLVAILFLALTLFFPSLTHPILDCFLSFLSLLLFLQPCYSLFEHSQDLDVECMRPLPSAFSLHMFFTRLHLVPNNAQRRSRVPPQTTQPRVGAVVQQQLDNMDIVPVSRIAGHMGQAETGIEWAPLTVAFWLAVVESVDVGAGRDGFTAGS